MQGVEGLSREQAAAFLEGSEGLEFEALTRSQAYAWIESTLREREYWLLGKKERGEVRTLLAK